MTFSMSYFCSWTLDISKTEKSWLSNVSRVCQRAHMKIVLFEFELNFAAISHLNSESCQPVSFSVWNNRISPVDVEA